MTTLISAYNRKAQLIGRCDARCYDGTGDRCRCLCGGINHGVGLRRAAKNTLALTDWDPEGLWVFTPKDQVRIEKNRKLSLLSHPTLFDTDTHAPNQETKVS